MTNLTRSFMVFLVNMAKFTSGNNENYAEEAKKCTTGIYNKLSLKTLLDS